MVVAGAGGGESVLTWRGLDDDSNAMARMLTELGVNPTSMVVVCLGNVTAHFVATIAAWKLGACALPLSPRLPDAELGQILETVGTDRLVVSEGGRIGEGLDLSDAATVSRLARTTASPIEITTPNPGKAIGSGGSTGRSKVIVDPSRWESAPGAGADLLGDLGFRPGQTQLVAGPLYHNSPFSLSHYGLFEDHTLVVMERFDAQKAVDLIEKHQVNFAFLAPTMMLRISRLPDIDQRDLSSIESIYHTAMACPEWLKRDWIARVGAEQVYEAYGATENIGFTTIRGDEWLVHPGSVGKPRHCEIRVLADSGAVLPSGSVGELHFRSEHYPEPSYRYLGAEPLTTTPDGFSSVGDLGWLDDEGYLFIADRRVDLIITGGVNVYPAEVEAVLLEHPAVRDAVVVGVPDAEWGRRVHAIVEPSDRTSPPTDDELDRYLRARLHGAKRPKSYELIAQLPRDESGKIRRSALVAERSADEVSTR